MGAVVALLHNLIVHRDEGQDLIEYGLLTALIAIVAFTAVTAVGTTVNGLFWETFTGALAAAAAA